MNIWICMDCASGIVVPFFDSAIRGLQALHLRSSLSLLPLLLGEGLVDLVLWELLTSLR